MISKIVNFIIDLILGIIGLSYNLKLFFSDVLSPAFYSYSKRIYLPELKGIDNTKNGRYCIFNIYSPGDLMPDHRLILRELKAQKINVICVFVGLKGRSQDEEFLKEHAHVTLYRVNMGRDFGAYKDGIHYLKSVKDLDLESLILLNDSCFIRKEGFAELIQKLSVPSHEVTAVFETLEHTHHLQSFCLSFTKKVFNGGAFNKYWQKYRPFTARTYSINRGEKGLTRALKKASLDIDVIYTVDQSSLGDGLILDDGSVNFGLLAMLPTSLREMFTTQYDGYIEKFITSDTNNQEYTDRAFETFRFNVQDLVLSVCSEFNSVHYLGPLVAYNSSCPMLKKDIFYRQVYRTFAESERVLRTFYGSDTELYRFAITTIRHKSYGGSGANILKLALLARGYI